MVTGAAVLVAVGAGVSEGAAVDTGVSLGTGVAVAGSGVLVAAATGTGVAVSVGITGGVAVPVRLHPNRTRAKMIMDRMIGLRDMVGFLPLVTLVLVTFEMAT